MAPVTDSCGYGKLSGGCGDPCTNDVALDAVDSAVDVLLEHLGSFAPSHGYLSGGSTLTIHVA